MALRMSQFIERNQEGDFFYSHAFGVDSACTVKTIGVGGWTVDKLWKFDLQAIRGTAPIVVILNFG